MKLVKMEDAEVPKIGLGTWQIKGTDCRKAVENALEMGYRHIDTAQIYGNEEHVGTGIANSSVDREDIWLTTKIWRTNFHPEAVISSFHESLEKLQTEYVDLLLIHWPSEEIDFKDTLEAMKQLKDKDKVRHIGVSNFTPEQLEEAQKHADILTNQVEYHPFLAQDELLEKCRKTDTMLTAYSPLARGDVIGNETLQKIGEKYDKSETQVALRWLVQQENICAIPKSSTREHQKSNIDVFDFDLDENEIKEINGLARNDRKVDPDFGPWN